MLALTQEQSAYIVVACFGLVMLYLAIAAFDIEKPPDDDPLY